ncbi:hypothetical protein ACFP2T_32185 [Plantactinospora solaniradicis]|uniref:MFS transporter n=1 Tax=Plantactinospora solaniradicis TaxID=1723736 RepID=A0ABW1KGE7_9ACTN
MALDAARAAYVPGLHAVGWAVVWVAGTIALLGIAFLRRLPEVIATDGHSVTSKDEDGGTRGS